MLCSINLDISSILDSVVDWIGSVFTFMRTTTVQITDTLSISLLSLFIGSLALAILIDIIFPLRRTGDIGADSMEDYQD